MVVGAFVTAPPAVADSIHVEASPPSPEAHGKWTLMLSGEASDESSTVDVGVVGGTEAPCPSPSFFGQSLVQVPVPLGRFTFTEAETANYAPEDVCAYVVHESAVTASAGLVVKTVPSLEEREEAAARQVPVKSLSVRVVSHFGQTTSAAGFATLYVTTSPFAYVTVRLSRFGHRTEHLEWGRAETAPASVVRWTCSRPGGTYRYQVTARTNVGSTLVRRGRFAAISAARCHAMERQEAELENGTRELTPNECAEKNGKHGKSSNSGKATVGRSAALPSRCTRAKARSARAAALAADCSQRLFRTRCVRAASVAVAGRRAQRRSAHSGPRRRLVPNGDG